MGQEQKQTQQETTDQTTTQNVTNLEDFTPEFREAIGGFQGFQQGATKAFSGGLNPIVQNVISQGQQNIKAQQAAGQRDLARNLSTAGSGNNATLLNVLGGLGNQQSSLAQNALAPIALQHQREFDVADRQANLAAGQNQANLLNILGGLVKGRAGQETRQTGSAARKSKTKSGFAPFV